MTNNQILGPPFIQSNFPEVKAFKSLKDLPSFSNFLGEASLIVWLTSFAEFSGLGAILDAQRADPVVPRGRHLVPPARVHLLRQHQSRDGCSAAAPGEPRPSSHEFDGQKV